MPKRPGDRIFGVETEFGCLVSDDSLGSPESAVEVIKDYIFYELRLGAIDLHARDDVFEPAQSGGFMMNGARLYIDAVGSHLEYATAECRGLKDLVANDRAGHRQIVRAIRELGWRTRWTSTTTPSTTSEGTPFGCHENYLVRADDDFLNGSVPMFYPSPRDAPDLRGRGTRRGAHPTSGGLRPSYQEVMDNPVDYIWVSHVYNVVPDGRVQFQLSQRADHIIKTIASASASTARSSIPNGSTSTRTKG